MEAGLALLGASSDESVVSKVETVVDADAELELGLGLSIGGSGGTGGGGGKTKVNAWGERGRILTAKDFPCVITHPIRGNSNTGNGNVTAAVSVAGAAVSGTKRAADYVSHEGGSPTAARSSQVVGWPPIRAYRINSLINHAKASRSEEDKPIDDKDESNDGSKKKICNEKAHLGFVKVNMDGLPIGRKVDLNSHASYESLARTLEDMFFRSAQSVPSVGGEKQQPSRPSKLLDSSSEFVLTYEDKEGDWMLVGDVPWRMFLASVKRLRIMKTSEANGLAPRCQEGIGRQRSKPI